MSLRVGYIGLGIMGSAMAANILKAGFPLVVYNRTETKANPLIKDGARLASSPADLAKQVDVVMTNLPDSPEVLDMLFGDGGVAAAMKPGSVFIDNSTIKPSAAIEISTKLEALGISALDCPVSGGDVGAKNGTLSVMVGGNAEVLDRVRPVLEAVSKTITHIGGPGAGQVCKGANQIMVAAQMVAMGEMMVFASKCGVDPERVIDATRGGAAQCWTLDVKPPRIFAGNRGPGFKAAMQNKDLNIVTASASEYGVPLPATSVNAQLYQAMVQNGMGEQDNSAVLGILESMARTKVGPAPDEGNAEGAPEK